MVTISMSTYSRYSYNSNLVSQDEKNYYLKLILHIFKFHAFRLNGDLTRFDL